MNIQVYEIFDSINGEVCHSGQGSLATFIRLAGCNLKCSYCDAKKAQNPKSGYTLSIPSVVGNTKQKNVTITGGEPLLQYDALALLCVYLKETAHTISLETNGTILKRPKFVDCVIMDYKLPSAKVKNVPNITKFADWAGDYLRNADWIKFVISDRLDFDIALKVIKAISICFPSIAFSANTKTLSHKKLLEWMFKAKIKAALNVQIHKLIGVQ